ncbi:MAG: putative manganese transporter [Candidatus Thermoplasmatota archaeon]|nr:putative manganese transporter [Candidatus Thermoplasmatota archaeon]
MVSMDEVVVLVVESMRDAFLAVTVFVAAMVLLFSWLQYVTAGRFVELIRNNKRLQPVIGAFMGLTPGCGGAIIMMPMYARGYVTYGTVIATLIATLGDAAFVLIGAAVTDSSFIAPVIAVHLISFGVGVTWGYLADGMGVTPRQPLGRYGPTFGSQRELTEDDAKAMEDGSDVLSELGREEPEGLGYRILHQGYMIWWFVTAIGLIFAILLLFWSAQDAEFALELSYNPVTLHGFITWVGLIGTILSVVLFISQKTWISDDTEVTIGDKLHSMKETLIHAASETAFVTFWVMAAYLVFGFTMLLSGIEEADLAKYGGGELAVLVAALIGLIPGCGPQIIAITAYTKDMISFPALTANAISQDGDALFPLLVRHKAASLWATIHTTLPALITGFVLLYLGVDF